MLKDVIVIALLCIPIASTLKICPHGSYLNNTICVIDDQNAGECKHLDIRKKCSTEYFYDVYNFTKWSYGYILIIPVIFLLLTASELYIYSNIYKKKKNPVFVGTILNGK